MSVNDGKLTTTYTFDSSSEHRGLITSQDIGVTGAPSTFAASYNPDGGLDTETYPSGLTARTVTDNAGNPTSLTYAKSGTTWMTFTATNGDGDRTVGQTSPQSSQEFTYDAADRLTTTRDTDTTSGNCTTRSYTFDTHSNRTELDSYPAAIGGACSTSTTPTVTRTSYDSADRNTTTGYTYDTLGRTLTLPSGDAQGIGSHAGTTGTLTIAYNSNDMVSNENQGPATLTFNLDPAQNRPTSTSDGTSTTTNHYTDNTDGPSWTATATSWIDNITGPNGDLAATSDQTGTVTSPTRQPAR